MSSNFKAQKTSFWGSSFRMAIMILVLFFGHQFLISSRWEEPVVNPEPIVIEHEEALPSPPVISVPEFEFEQKGLLPQLFDLLDPYSGTKQLRKLKLACDYMNVRSEALDIIDDQNPDGFDLADIADIFDFVYSDWNYVDDPVSNDHVFPASQSIVHLKGDCDDFSALLCALISAIGGQSRVNYVYNQTDGHAYTEVCLGIVDLERGKEYLQRRYSLPFGTPIYFEEDSSGNIWLPLDWFADYPGGKPFDYMEGYRFYVLQNYYETL